MGVQPNIARAGPANAPTEARENERRPKFERIAVSVQSRKVADNDLIESIEVYLAGATLAREHGAPARPTTLGWGTEERDVQPHDRSLTFYAQQSDGARRLEASTSVPAFKK
jgi:hypothetical protein